MRSISKFMLLPFALVLLFGACKKYDEGPYVSVIPREDRVVNEWEVEKAKADNGDNITSNYDGQVWEFTDGGKMIRSHSSGWKYQGEWEFQDDDEEIKVTYNSSFFSDQVYDILKLKDDEMWLVDEDQGTEFHLQPY